MTVRIKRSLIVDEDPSGIEVKEHPEYVERGYEIIKRMDFNSDRKRMSIVVRD
jgi:magnesium-transporting ATPase (P-type)